MKVKTAGPLVRAILRMRKAKGVTYPWGIYVMPGEEKNAGLIAHERVHAQQVERMGAVWYLVKYSAMWLRYGYERHPMEIEAREKSGHR